MIFHSLVRWRLLLPGAVAPLLLLPVLVLGMLGMGREGSRCRLLCWGIGEFTPKPR